MSEQPGAADEPTVSVVAGAVSDGAYTLLIADFPDTASAREAYDALKEVEDGRHVEIEGVIVVKPGPDGRIEVQKATDHATRRGADLGSRRRGGPGAHLSPVNPRQRRSARSRRGGRRRRPASTTTELADELEAAIQPGHSGIVALVSDPAVVELRRALRTADTIVQTAIDDVVAKDVKAAAKEAKEAEQADPDAEKTT